MREDDERDSTCYKPVEIVKGKRGSSNLTVEVRLRSASMPFPPFSKEKEML